MLKDKVIVSELVGALGNQLFSWAAGYSLSKRLNFTHHINSRKITTHGCYLSDFQIENTEYPIDNNLDFLDFCDNSKFLPLVKFSKTLKTLDASESLRPQVFEERSYHYDRRVESIHSSKVLRGYFQSWRYFKDDMDEIRIMLNNNGNPSNEFKSFEAALNGQAWVAIHVRRKDYVSYSQFHGLTTPEYYTRSLRVIKSEYRDILKVVFSDDIDSAKEIVQGDLYIGSSELPSPSETLKLMSKASCIIGSNSTFSWWSSFMMSDTNLAIFPRPWFASQLLNTNDLLLPNWLTVGNEK